MPNWLNWFPGVKGKGKGGGTGLLIAFISLCCLIWARQSSKVKKCNLSIGRCNKHYS